MFDFAVSRSSAVAVLLLAGCAGSTASARPLDDATTAAVYSDPAMLSALLAQQQAAVHALTVEYEVTTYQNNDAAALGWRVQWGPAGFVIEAQPAGSGRLIADGSRRVWDAAAKSARVIWFDPTDGLGEVQTTTDPDTLHIGELVPEYSFLIGMLPTRKLATGGAPSNDVATLLTRPNVSILPGPVECEGYSCFIIEERRDDGSPLISIAVAPSLGGAVVRSETYRAGGSLASRWIAQSFWQPNPGTIALPLSGVSKTFAADGSVSIERRLDVKTSADGSPKLLVGVGPTAEDLAIPVGFEVVNVDTGETWIAGASTGGFGWPTGLAALAAGIAVLGTAFALRTLRRRRPMPEPALAST
jgi:hypothetical protein